MKGRSKRAGGGVVEKEDAPRDVYAGGSSNVVKEVEGRKRGGRVKKEVGKIEGGKMSKMRLDRPGRKMGGRVGAEKSPLSSAAKTSGPDGGPSTMDCDD